MFDTAIIFGVTAAAAVAVYLITRLTAGLARLPTVALALAGAGLFAVSILAGPKTLLLQDLGILLVAGLVGSGLALLVTTKPALVAFVAAAGIADFLSATRGLTAQLSNAYQEGSSNLILLLSVSVRQGDHIQQIVGIGDLVLLGVVFAALHRLQYRGSGSFIAPTAGLLLALLVGILAGGVPAMPFIAGTTIALLVYKKAETDEA